MKGNSEELEKLMSKKRDRKRQKLTTVAIALNYIFTAFNSASDLP